MKIPVGKISFTEALQRYLKRRRDWVEDEGFSPEEAYEAASELRTAFERGDLVAEVCDGTREFRLTPDQWRMAPFPERPFFGGKIVDSPDGPLADYNGLHPYTDEVAFNRWLARQFDDNVQLTVTQPSKKTAAKKQLTDGDQQLKKRLVSVISWSRDKWGTAAKRPAFRQMAAFIKSQKRDQGFSQESLRQILSGRYSAMERFELKGIDG